MQQAEHFQKIDANLLKFNILIDQIAKIRWKQAILQAKILYNLKTYKIQKLYPTKIKQMYFQLTKKYHQVKKQKQQWLINQLSIFIWLSFAYSAYIKKNLKFFQIQDWIYISQFFYGKNASLCQFQYNNIKNTPIKIQKWTSEQDKLLKQIFNDFSNNRKWNKIAKQLFQRSNKQYCRTPKQCRQRWNNYHDPSKYKGQWKLDEDLLVVNQVMKRGKKWAVIGKMLQNNRTQHMVKNRYNFLSNRQKKQDKIYKTIAQIQLIKRIQNRIKKQLDKQIPINLFQGIQNIKLPEIQNNVCQSPEDSQLYEIYENKKQKSLNFVKQISIDENYDKVRLDLMDGQVQKKETLVQTYEQNDDEMMYGMQNNNLIECDLGYSGFDFLNDKKYNNENEGYEFDNFMQ